MALRISPCSCAAIPAILGITGPSKTSSLNPAATLFCSILSICIALQRGGKYPAYRPWCQTTVTRYWHSFPHVAGDVGANYNP